MVSQISSGPEPLRALVVDEDGKTRQRICKALTRKGIEVRACSSLSQGREFFSAERIVLARSEGGGSEFNGFVDWVRERSGESQPYIVAIDDGAAEGDVMLNAAANPGCDAVMPAPADEHAMEERLKAIDRWLESSPGSTEPAAMPPVGSPFQIPPNAEAVPLGGRIVYANVLVENAPLAMAMFDREMRYLVANRKWQKEFHLEDVALVGQSHYELFPRLPESWRRLFERCLARGVIERREEDVFERPDGTIDWVRWEVRPWHRADGAIGGLIITSEVITDRRAVDEGRRFERDFTGSLLEHAETPVMTVDLEGRVQRHNPASGALLPDIAAGPPSPFYWDVLGDPVETAGEKLWFLGMVRSLRETGRVETPRAFVCRLPGGARNGSVPPARRRFAWSRIPQIGRDETIEGFILVGVEVEPAGAADLEFSPAGPAARPVAIGGGVAREEWKRRERDLIEERRLAVAIGENAPIGLILVDRKGKPIYCNPQHKAVLGFDATGGGDIESWLRRGCPDEEYAREVLDAWREKIWRKQLPEIFTLATSEGLLKDVRFDAKLLEDGSLLLSVCDVTDARRTEEALFASEAKCRALFRGSRTGMVLVDRCGDVIDINAALEDILGLSRWEVRAKPLGVLVCPGDLANLDVIDTESALEDQNLHEIEIRLLRKGGQPVRARLGASPVRSQDGGLLLTAYTVSEIAARQDADREWRDSHEQSRALLEAIPDLIMMLDANAKVIDMIPAAGEFLALDADRVIREGLGGEFSALAENIHQLLLEVHEQERGVVRFEFTTGGGAESARRLEARLVKCGEMNTLVMIGDVTDREAAQSSLRRQALAFENVGDAIVLTDARGRITDFNPASERLFGYPKREVVGEPLYKLYAPADPRGFNGRISDAMGAQRQWAGRERFVHKDGSEGDCEVLYVPVEGPRGGVAALVGINRPAPPAGATASPEAALRSLHEQVGAELQMIGDLLNLRAGSPAATGSRKILREQQSRILAVAFIHRLLAGDGDRGRVDFSKFIESLVEHLRRTFGVGHERVEVSLEWKNALLRPREAVALGLIANELLGNAFEHAFPGARRGEVRARFERRAGEAIFTVADNGAGLPLTFDLDDPSTPGMRVVKILVERLNGGIVLADSPDTEFRVRFPAGDD